MDNQHRKITGYRELSQAEIDLMNDIKAHAEQTRSLAARIDVHLLLQAKRAREADSINEHHRIGNAEPRRWLLIATTDFQTGFMALTRAVAQPTTF